MYQYVYSRRGRNLIAYYNTTKDRWINQDYLFSITLSGKEAEFYNEFYREAECKSPRTEWGKERNLANKEDIMNKGERTGLEAIDAQVSGAAPSGGHEAAIIAKIDASRGRYEEDDIYPGVFRDADGLFQCAKFIPERRESIRATFAELKDALTWITYQNDYYNKRAR
jgi:hypothetical protein